MEGSPFVGHGAFGILTKQGWVPDFGVYGIPEVWALWIGFQRFLRAQGSPVLAAHVTGLGWRQAAVLRTFMNTRGLMELIVLNIGLDLKVISPTLFAMMVLMALATTLSTAPVLQVLMPSTVAEDESGRASSFHC